MNTANLQLEGLLLAVAAILRTLTLTRRIEVDDVDAALQDALRQARTELQDRGELSPANHNAALFPIRFLITANLDANTELSFRNIAARIGEGEPTSR